MAQERSSTEIGTLIFAVVSVVTLGVAALVFGGLTAYVSTQMNKSIEGQDLMPYMVNLIIILVSVLVYFAFSALLLNGILKKNSKQILAYIVFGVIVTILSTCGAISWVLLGPSENNRNILIGGVWLFLLFVYTLILVVISMAHRKVKPQDPTRTNKEVITLNTEDFQKFGVDTLET